MRPDGDVDLLILTYRPLTTPERTSLVSMLASISGRKGHASQFPEAANRRPLEVTSLVVKDVRPLGQRPHLKLLTADGFVGSAERGVVACRSDCS